MTDQQKAYAHAVRVARARRCASEAHSPLTEESAARLLERHGADAVRRLQEMHEDARFAATNAEVEAERLATLCTVQLGRPLTSHEREGAFGTQEHRWWLSNPRDPCPECVGPEVAAVLREGGRVAYRRLLGLAVRAVPHSEACDCRACVPEPARPAEGVV